MGDVKNLTNVYDLSVPGHYSTDDYTFFWAGPFSNWHKSPFEMWVSKADRAVKFNCSEQAMMYLKALEFADFKTAEKIMETSDPKKQKQLGRQIQRFDEDHWSKVRLDQAVSYLRHKFIQNLDLFKILMDTGNREIVEASPYDNVWGCGMGVDKYPQILDKANWTGTNLLGEALMRVREELRPFLDFRNIADQDKSEV